MVLQRFLGILAAAHCRGRDYHSVPVTNIARVNSDLNRHCDSDGGRRVTVTVNHSARKLPSRGLVNAR